ncbi:MAG: alpha/beta hydrolase [Acidobacteriota bacterium]
MSVAAALRRRAMRAAGALPPSLLRRLTGPPIERDGQTLDPLLGPVLRVARRGGSVERRGVLGARRWIRSRSSLLTPAAPRAVEWHDEPLALAGGARSLIVRRYRPSGAEPTNGLLIFFHGGGWVTGSLDSHHGVCATLAQRAGCDVASVDYRLAPEHPWPAAVDDAEQAMVALVEREGDGEGRPIAVGGDSAGGHLAAVAARHARAHALPLAAQLLVYPVLIGRGADRAHAESASVRLFGDGFALDTSTMGWFFEQHVGGRDGIDLDDPRLSPGRADDLVGLAPAVVVTAGFDVLRDEGEDYAEQLAAAGVATRFRRFPSLVHGFLHLAGGIPTADAALSTVADDLADALRGELDPLRSDVVASGEASESAGDRRDRVQS